VNGPEHFTAGERHLSAASYLDKPGGRPADPTTATYHLLAAQAHFAAAQVAVDAARLADKYIGDGAHINEWLAAVGWLPQAGHTEDHPISLPAAQKDLAVHTTAEAWVNLGHALREKREAKGLSRRALAEIAQVSEKAIQTAEEGRKPAGRWPQSLNQIATALDWSPAEVVDFLRAQPPF
jgi:DNA-binding XRE family transcriptional regulator